MAGFKTKVDMKGLEKFNKQMKRLNAKQQQQWTEAAIKELAARLLANVIKRTPKSKDVTETIGTGEFYKRGEKKGQEKTKTQVIKKGGTLQRGWTVGEVVKTGDTYTIEVINPVEYAEYVEFGHRTRNHKGWVEGRFMMTISEMELQADAPRILMNKLNKYVGELFP